MAKAVNSAKQEILVSPAGEDPRSESVPRQSAILPNLFRIRFRKKRSYSTSTGWEVAIIRVFCRNIGGFALWGPVWMPGKLGHR